MNIFEYALKQRGLVEGIKLRVAEPAIFTIPRLYRVDGNIQQYDERWVCPTAQIRSKVHLWRTKIQSGVSASSPFTRSSLSVTHAQPLHAVWTEKRWDFTPGEVPAVLRPFVVKTWTASGFPRPVGFNYTRMDGLISESDKNRAIAKLHEKIRSDRSQMNGLVTLGELRETIRMFRKPFRSMLTLLGNLSDGFDRVIDHHSKRYDKDLREASQIKRRRRESAEQHLSRKRSIVKQRRKVALQAVVKDVSGLYLEFKFGLSPLISDVEDSAIALRRAIEAEERHRRFTSYVKPETRRLISNPQAGQLGECEWRGHYAQTLEHSLRYTAIYKAQVDGPRTHLDNLAEKAGLTLENFVPAIYELLPWSFLVDYFSNLGNLIECSTTSTRGLITCVSSERFTTTTEFYARLSPVPRTRGQGIRFAADFVQNSGSEIRVKGVTIRRNVLDSLPVPKLVFTIPGATSSKWATIVSLFASRASKDVRTEFPSTLYS